MNTRITELFGIQYPIIQGGMAHLAYANLAAAVSNAGGLGQITATSLDSPEQLKKEIEYVRKLTDKPFGVNFAIGSGRRPFQELLDLAISEEVPAISVTGGNPEALLTQLNKTNIKTLVLTASVRQAKKAEQLGTDCIIAVGFEGGGHIGLEDVGTMVLIPKIVDSVKIPVVAAGGIGDGRGFMAALSLGAEGIEMGTRFIATKECIAHSNYKEGLIQLTESDTVIIKRSLRQPGRAIRNQITEFILEMESNGATFDDMKKYLNADANKAAIYQGDYENAYSWAGQVIGLIKDVPTTQQLIDRIIHDAQNMKKRINDIWVDI